MTAQVAQIHGDEQQALARERGKQSDYAEIPHMGRVDAGDRRGALREKQRKQHAQRRERAIRGNVQRADVKEDWMHLCQDTAFRLQS